MAVAELPDKPESTQAGLSTRWTILAAFLFAGVLAGIGAYRFLPRFTLDIPDRTLSESEKDAVFACMRMGLMNEYAADECVERFGWQALPFHQAVIQDTAEQVEVRGNASFIAGKYGDEETARVIENFVGEIAGPGLSGEELGALAMALDGLGFNGQPQAIAFLESVADPTHWKDEQTMPTKEGEDDPARAVSILRRRAVRGLGLAPKGAGIESLERIRDAWPELEVSCTAALADARKRRLGLDRLSGIN